MKTLEEEIDIMVRNDSWSREEYINKWTTTGLLDGLDLDDEKYVLSRLLEAASKATYSRLLQNKTKLGFVESRDVLPFVPYQSQIFYGHFLYRWSIYIGPDGHLKFLKFAAIAAEAWWKSILIEYDAK